MILGHQQNGICEEYRRWGEQMSQRHGSRWRRSRFLCWIHGQMENHVKMQCDNAAASVWRKNLQITVIAIIIGDEARRRVKKQKTKTGKIDRKKNNNATYLKRCPKFLLQFFEHVVTTFHYTHTFVFQSFKN